MPFSSEDLAMMQARLNRRFTKPPEVEAINDAVAKESDLQQQIRNFLYERRWAFFWSPMHKASSAGMSGITDFIVAAPNGRTLWVEAKSRTGKLRTEQLGFKMLLEANGHEHHVVRSYREFCEVVARQ